MGRDSTRDFPPREPPRGPKALIQSKPPIEPPSGPRVPSYGGGDFRGDFGFRGDYRGRGRGRARGGWRDDSRDRDRDMDRDFRGPRDDRGPPFRDDRSHDRDRWSRDDSFRGRRASSPQGRGRSPNYRPSLDVDRARRGSRDGPLSGGSPSSESIQAFRGFGRGRGGRGRGRGAHFDEFHYPRNASPDPKFPRRTQPSATPPPQVPAFGSTNAGLPISISAAPTAIISVPVVPLPLASTSVAPKIPAGPASGSSIGPLPGVAIPTEPRSQRLEGNHVNRNSQASSAVLRTSPKIPKKEVSISVDDAAYKAPSPVQFTSPTLPRNDDVHIEADQATEGAPLEEATISEPSPVTQQPGEPSPRKRAPIVGRRPPKPIERETPQVPHEDPYDSDGDSVDSIGRGDFFEEDIKKIEDQISQLPSDPEGHSLLTLKELGELANRPVPDDPQELVIWNAEIKRHAIWRQEEFKQHLVDISPWAPRSDPVPNAQSLKPFVDFVIDSKLLENYSATHQTSVPEACVSKQQDKEAASSTSNTDATAEPVLETRSEDQGPTTLSPKSDLNVKPHPNGDTNISGTNLEPSSQTTVPISDNRDNISQAPASSIQPQSPAEPETKAEHVENVEGAGIVDSATNGKAPKINPKMEPSDESEDEQSRAEHLEQLQAVRRMMKTPSISSLPNFGTKPPFEDEYLQKSLTALSNRVVDELVIHNLKMSAARRKKEQTEERKKWAERYYKYRKWTDHSGDMACVRSRKTFEKAKEDAAADLAATKSSTPGPNSRPETQRRTGSRFATEHELQRVLQESRQEAIKTQEEVDRGVREATASAKEATIPDMCWDQEQWDANLFRDYTHLVPFDRAINILQCGEPIDNFTEEETEFFLKAYLEYPKQWGKIAEALPQRDYKACIQHYYLKKHTIHFKDKLKKQGKRGKGRAKGTGAKGAKPKSNALIADIVSRDDGEDGGDTENGRETRRPRRAAAPTWNFEASVAPSETASPVPTPGRKAGATPKIDNGTDGPPAKKKTKAVREKGPKQAKNSQLLAAAPTPVSRPIDSPPIQPTSAHTVPAGINRFPAPYDAAVQVPTSFPTSPYPPPSNTTPINFEPMTQTFSAQPRLGSVPPMGFDHQERQNLQQTSSYWSVPEQTDFPELLRYFGTDWHGIAKHMTSKTHIMVYTTVFQQWLIVPSDSNRSRCVTNIQTQVKNYYIRQVELGQKSGWRVIAQEADDKKSRGESTGPLPAPTTIIPKPRGHTVSSTPRSGSVMDGVEDMPAGTSILQQGSPTPAGIPTSRYTALAQAGPSRTSSQPATPTSLLSKHLPREQQTQHAPQQLQHTPQQIPQQVPPQQPRSRGPALGYFHTDPQRPIMQASNSHGQSGPSMPDAASQRSRQVAEIAQAAQIERQEALRIQEQGERERAASAQAQQQNLQREQQQAIDMQRQQQAMRQLQMKQEAIEKPNPHQFEQYSSPRPNHLAHSRTDSGGIITGSENRRTAPTQPQYTAPRSHQPFRNLLSDNSATRPEVNSSSSVAAPRASISVPPAASQEQYNPPSQIQNPVVAPPRPSQAVSKKSNIMSLLNNDDDAVETVRPTPTQRVSEASVLQVSHTPPPQHGLQQSRYLPQNAPQTPTQPQQASHQIPHLALQHQTQQHPYAPSNSSSMHQHSSSIGQTRSYTPNSFEARNYGGPSAVPVQHQQQQHQQQQQQQQQPQPTSSSMYAQPSRQSSSTQPTLRREPSGNDVHSLSGGYTRSSGPPQPSMRLKESPYSATPPPQSARQQIQSPLEHAPALERDYYSNRQQYHLGPQPNAAGSPQLGPTYNPQPQHPAPSHRQLAFGQGISHTASPPTQYATQHSLHRSRHNSFDGRDGRYPPAATSAPPSQQGYHQAPQHHGTPLAMQHQQFAPQGSYETQADRERRAAVEDNYRRQQQEDYNRRGELARRDELSIREEMARREEIIRRDEMARRR